jgi:hypothetical protein
VAVEGRIECKVDELPSVGVFHRRPLKLAEAELDENILVESYWLPSDIVFQYIDF